MQLTGAAVVDHHQFVVGAPTAETYEPFQTGSVMEVGANFVTVLAGIAYGPVAVTVEVTGGPPPFDPHATSWQVVEEVTLKVTKAWQVLTLDGNVQPDFDRIPITRGLHTFRVSACGRDEQPDLDVAESGEQYLLQIWRTTQPSDMIRLHKTDAAYPGEIVTHPKRNWWDPDPAGDATLYLKYGYEQMAEWAKDEARKWGGRPPSEKLRSNHSAKDLAFHDRALADAITRAKPEKLWAIAAWAARRAYTIAGLSQIDWIAAALDALDRGEELPRPFGTDELYGAIQTAAGVGPPPDFIDRSYRPPAASIAMTAVPDAVRNDYPLNAVFRTLRTAARTDDGDYASLIADLRAAFFPRLMPIEKYERWI